MATPPLVQKCRSSDECNEISNVGYQERISTFPKVDSWFNVDLRLYEGWYCPSFGLPGVMCMKEHFKGRPSDVLVVSFPKTGTTWLKALIYAIVNRVSYKKEAHPLLTKVSHDLVQSLEIRLYLNGKPSPLLEDHPSPRLLHTHLPYTSLPIDMTNNSPKFVYIARDPKDVLISFWHFSSKTISRWSLDDKNNKAVANMTTLEDACDLFCRGICPYGPYWDHVLSYWKISIEFPQRFLFLKYEELEKEPQFYIKKLAEFLGQPFSIQEEEEGEVQSIMDLCSFKTLSNIKVNMTGTTPINISYDSFYRKGKVGDWKNYLTPDMVQRIDQITKRKFHGYGLTL